MTRQYKYQFIVSIHSDKDSKAELIYDQLKRYVFRKYSRRVTFNKLYKIIDIKKERKEKENNKTQELFDEINKSKKSNDIKFINED